MKHLYSLIILSTAVFISSCTCRVELGSKCTKSEVKAPEYSEITLEQIALNIADSRARRFVSMQVHLSVKQECRHLCLPQEEGENTEPSLVNYLRHATIEIVGSKSMEYLNSVEQRRILAIELQKRYNEIIEQKAGVKNAVREVIFPKFLIQ